MSYYFKKVVNMTFEETLEKAAEELKKEGFGVLTRIDVAATLKEKIGVDFHKYQILGACNPQFAYQALQAEDTIGLMLPCNVVVQEKAGQVEVSAVDPVASMQAIVNPALGNIARQVREKLQRVIRNV